jgi:hypothetical protein
MCKKFLMLERISDLCENNLKRVKKNTNFYAKRNCNKNFYGKFSGKFQGYKKQISVGLILKKIVCTEALT